MKHKVLLSNTYVQIYFSNLNNFYFIPMIKSFIKLLYYWVAWKNQHFKHYKSLVICSWSYQLIKSPPIEL